MVTEPEPTPLDWHYGPTPTDPDPGKMWCYDCGGEVWWFKNGPPNDGGGYICTKCSRTGDE